MKATNAKMRRWQQVIARAKSIMTQQVCFGQNQDPENRCMHSGLCVFGTCIFCILYFLFSQTDFLCTCLRELENKTQSKKDALEYDVAKSNLGQWLRAVNSHMLIRRLVLSTGLSLREPRVPLSPSEN